MRFEFKPSFKRSIKSFSKKEKEEIKEVSIQLIDMLSQDRSVHKGVGLKRLRGDFWEIRKGIKSRILFRWNGDLVEFVLAGNHNHIKRFLKNI
jgi:mRNA-degrading endonuclease RelE of RelBE toxin-antitoxin system